MRRLTLLDANALIAFLTREPAADRVRGLLREGGAAITAVNLAEAVDVLARRHGVTVERSRPVVEGLTATSLQVLPVDAAAAWAAGRLRAAHYDRVRRPLSMADCVLLAVAQEGHAIVATSDDQVLETAAEEGLETTPLPASR